MTTIHKALEQALGALEINRVIAKDADGNYTREVTPKIILDALTEGRKALAEQAPIIQTDQRDKQEASEFHIALLRELADTKQSLLATENQLATSQKMLVTALQEAWNEQAPSTAGERDRTIVSLPIPASASDLKSDIAELIQSHKYKGLRSIEVLGVFQFLGAEIISGSNS